MKKLLKISHTPTYNTFNDLAFAFAVIDSSKTDYLNWLVSNFIGIYYKKKWDAICFKMPYCHSWQCFNSKLIFYNSYNYSSFIRSIEKQINNNRYIYICVNERFIPERFAYNNEDFVHDLYIYGYDNIAKKFFTGGYNTSKHFTLQEISYEQVFLAQKNKFFRNVYFSFKLDENYDFKKISHKRISFELFRYFFPISKFSGINIFKYLIKHYQQDEIKMGYAKLLCEHIDIISKLSLVGYTFDCDKLVKLSEKLFYLSLKYTVTSNKKLLDNCIDLINEIKSYEINAFYNCYFKTLSKAISKAFLKKYNDYL